MSYEEKKNVKNNITMDWSNPLGSAISGVFGLIGQKINYDNQLKLMEKQNQFNLDMWNLQNAYNSPQSQMLRYEKAGLNPALIYSQGNPGNAVSAPVQRVPEAPDISEDMRQLGQAFNIEGLKTIIANRKKAQADANKAEADASIAHTTAKDVADEYAGKSAIGNDFYFDTKTGQFVVLPSFKRDLDGLYRHNVQNAAAYYMYRTLSDNYRTNSLLVPRANLIGSQRLLNSERLKLLAPQIRYWNFNTEPWRMKTNFWIGNVRQGAQAISPFF